MNDEVTSLDDWKQRFNALPPASRARVLLTLIAEDPDFQTTLEDLYPEPKDRARFIEDLQAQAEERLRETLKEEARS
ncbi:MAG: hypothetical protein KDJ28_00550 [Candidatus Competibacteraceae bacterium]|nr:hypothetical protein [Candidatus Competibacteraceae bacterium]